MASKKEVFKIKQYYTIEEVRRDLTKIVRYLEKLDGEVQEFHEALAFAYQRIKASTFEYNKFEKDPKVKVTNIPKRALNRTEVNKTFEALEELIKTKSSIINIITQLEQDLEEQKGADKMKKLAEKILRRTEKKLKDAHEAADKLARRTIPKELQNVVKRSFINLQESLRGRFNEDDSELSYVVYYNKEKNQQFYVAYLKLIDLKDDHGYVYPTFYILISQVIGVNIKTPYSIHTLTDFRLPSSLTFRRAQQVKTIKNIWPLINDTLAAEDFVKRVLPKDVPLDKKDLKFRNPKVEKAQIRKNQIYVTLKGRTSQKEAEKIRNELHGELWRIVNMRFPRNRDVIRSMVYKSGNVRKIKFIFTISGRSVNVSQQNLRKVQEIFNLTPSQLVKFREALESAGEY